MSLLRMCDCIHSHRILAVPSYYPLERVCPSFLRLPSSPFACSYAPSWCSFCPFALVHSYHMASPFSLETVSCCHDVLLVGSLPYFSIRHSVTPYNFHYSPFHLPLTSLDYPMFLPRERPRLGAIK
jgi:hypothetical protein